MGLKATVDADGDLMLEQQVLLDGGVTPDHLRAQFELWRRMVGQIAEHIGEVGRESGTNSER